jgi:hypothetical protein
MTEGRDPFEILRRANPVDSERLPEVPTTAHGRALFEEVIEMAASTTPTQEQREREPSRSPADKRPQRRAVVLVLVAAAVTAGFTFYALVNRVSEPLTIGCYAAVDLDADAAVVGADGRSPVTVCEELWRNGAVGPGAVPPLAACVLPSGAVGVFPSTDGDPCTTLQLAPLDSTSYPDEADEVVALRTSLVEKFLAVGCLDDAEATETVVEELEDRGMSGWTVERSGTFTAERPCASLAFDPEAETVTLVPVPRSS